MDIEEIEKYTRLSYEQLMSELADFLALGYGERLTE